MSGHDIVILHVSPHPYTVLAHSWTLGCTLSEGLLSGQPSHCFRYPLLYLLKEATTAR